MLKLILWLIIILLITFFVVFNVEPKVTVHLFPGVSLEGMPLALVIIVSFILGLLSGLLLALPRLIKAQYRVHQLEKERVKLTEEREVNAKDSAPPSTS